MRPNRYHFPQRWDTIIALQLDAHAIESGTCDTFDYTGGRLQREDASAETVPRAYGEGERPGRLR